LKYLGSFLNHFTPSRSYFISTPSWTSKHQVCDSEIKINTFLCCTTKRVDDPLHDLISNAATVENEESPLRREWGPKWRLINFDAAIYLDHCHLLFRTSVHNIFSLHSTTPWTRFITGAQSHQATRVLMRQRHHKPTRMFGFSMTVSFPRRHLTAVESLEMAAMPCHVWRREQEAQGVECH
jgi:hypothetical protein